MNELLKAIKKAALDAVGEAHPIEVCYGTVTAEDPLEVKISQKLILGKEHLALTGQRGKITVEKERYDGEKYYEAYPFEVQIDFKRGDKLMLLKIQGGQKYAVLGVAE